MQFYDGMTMIIDGLISSDIEGLRAPFLETIDELAKFIFNREIREKNTHEIDHLLVGKMKLLKSLLQKFPQ